MFFKNDSLRVILKLLKTNMIFKALSGRYSKNKHIQIILKINVIIFSEFKDDLSTQHADKNKRMIKAI